MRPVYFISALGADERAFASLDLSFCKPVFLKWIRPLQNERIENYARRMALLIEDENPLIVGLSFGGMLAVEIAKHINTERIIVISSSKSAREIPPWLKLLRYLPLHRLLRAKTIKQLNKIAYRVMGLSEREDKILFQQMLHDSDNDIFDWSLNAIIHWQNTRVPQRITHIHGQKDIILPARFIKADILVPDGEHLMPMIQPALVSKLIRENLPL